MKLAISKFQRLPRFLYRGKVTFCAVLLALPLLGSSLQGSVIADFTDGGSSDSPVINKVDAWNGKAGNGWTSAWATKANGGITVKANVKSANPLSPDLNYLNVTVSGLQTATGSGAIWRSYSNYEELALDAPSTISFLLRPDSPSSNMAQLQIWEGSGIGAVATAVGAEPTWFIRNLDNVWVFGDGGVARASLRSSEIAVVQDHIYEFTLQIDPASKSYIATISDLTASKTFTSSTLLFATDKTILGGGLTFSTSKDGVTESSFSLGSIAINPIPEPQTAYLLGGAALMLMVTYARHAQGKRSALRGKL